MSKVHYLCFYYEPEFENKVTAFPSVITKIDYISDVLKRCGYEVNLISLATSLKGKFRGFSKRIDANEVHTYFTSRKTGVAVLDKLFVCTNWLKILIYLLKNVKKNDKVLVYHSLYNRVWLKVWKKLLKRDFIMQIEDVYTSVDKDISRFETAEWQLFKLTDKHICVNDILAKQLDSKCAVVSYGNYKVPRKFEKEHGDKIRLVYAGVIEKVRNAAFLAAQAMEYLPENYELHILGFGNADDISELENMIADNNKAYYHGHKTGDEYLAFLQSCDIGLSTHAYGEEDMLSADHTFPSKVLVYMSNGLRVIAQRLECLEKSEMGDLISFYDTPDPECVAKAVLGIDLSEPYDSRARIHELDDDFVRQIKKMLSE